MDIGVDVELPKKKCEDRNCPFHGSLKVRGQIIKGNVVSDRMSNTVVVERNYLHYLRKYERYEKRKSRYLVHNPSCLDVKVGDDVRFMECRALSKAKSFVVIEKAGPIEEKEEIKVSKEEKVEKKKKMVRKTGKVAKRKNEKKSRKK
ncbi:MAG: 30S ribosomal protein S17 [Candidatus Hydrothermarchaeales archaeon]